MLVLVVMLLLLVILLLFYTDVLMIVFVEGLTEVEDWVGGCTGWSSCIMHWSVSIIVIIGYVVVGNS